MPDPVPPAPPDQPRGQARRNAAKRAISAKDYDGEALKVLNALTKEESELCMQVVIFGPAWLRHEKAWTATSIKAFLERTEIKREIDDLKRNYEGRTGLQERTQFFSQLKINSMVPAAINVLARALRGSYPDPATGSAVSPPTSAQYAAAVEVLDRANVQGGKFAGNDATPSIDARSISIAIGASVTGFSGLPPEGREKIRKLLASVVGRAKALQAADSRKVRAVKAVVRDDEPPVQDGAEPEADADEPEPDGGAE